MSNRTLTIILGVLIAIALVLGGYWFFAAPSNQPPATGGTQTGGGNPFGGGGTSTGGGTPAGGTVSVTGKDGTVMTVPDPTPNKASFSEGPDRYYYLTDESQQQYSIIYGSNSSVNISLLSEPLGSVRLSAQNELRKDFPLTDAQLCNLNVTVGVPNSVNSAYSGQNLGLSFCPGSVQLP